MHLIKFAKKIFLGLLASLVIFVSLVSCKKDHTSAGVKTFILVHGSFQGPWAWQFVQAQLEAAGQKVIAVELPGHGSDQTAPATLTLNAYRNKVIAAIETINEPVVLVGHSMGGAVITAVADSIPTHIQKLVYMAGFVPVNGQSITDLNMRDPNSQLTPALVPSHDFSTASVADSLLLKIFCQDGGAAINQLLVSNNRPEPAAPLYSKIILNHPDLTSTIPIYYIRTVNDRCITLPLQDEMIATAGITHLFTLTSSHSPHLSIPDSVTSILLTIIK